MSTRNICNTYKYVSWTFFARRVHVGQRGAPEPVRVASELHEHVEPHRDSHGLGVDRQEVPGAAGRQRERREGGREGLERVHGAVDAEQQRGEVGPSAAGDGQQRQQSPMRGLDGRPFPNVCT